MRTFADGDTITIELWRANAFPINKDLSCDRSAFDRIIQAGGYVSVNTGGASDGNEIQIPKNVAERAFGSATCIGCGACVAACKNSSAVLFVRARVMELALLPQGRGRGHVVATDRDGLDVWRGGVDCGRLLSAELPIRMSGISSSHRQLHA